MDWEFAAIQGPIHSVVPKSLGVYSLATNWKVFSWRVVPGDPSNNAFLQKFSWEMSSSWLPLRINEKVFRSVKEAGGTK
jgi:hypothetical protein